VSDWLTRIVRRRAFLRGAIVLPLGLVIAACDAAGDASPTTTVTAEGAASATAASGGATPATPNASVAPTGVTLEATPACVDEDDEPTISQTEGPYFTPNSPERASLIEADTQGVRLTVTGYVLTPGCTPVAAALIDFWQCDADGEYDNVGYRLRGHQFADAGGAWRLETILPGMYPGRTRHIHLKVQAPGRPVLTTQLYFPAETEANAADGIYDERLLLSDVVTAADGSMTAAFNFVLDA
jgi:protocatechuate 3,4-dioxygenase beta subunit